MSLKLIIPPIEAQHPQLFSQPKQLCSAVTMQCKITTEHDVFMSIHSHHASKVLGTCPDIFKTLTWLRPVFCCVSTGVNVRTVCKFTACFTF